MNVYSLVMDLAVLAVVVMCAVYYARRGFVAGVFSFFGTLIAVLLAGVAARFLSPAIFDLFFRAGMEKQVAETIAEQGVTDLYNLVQSVLRFVPEGLLEFMGIEVNMALDYTAPDVAANVVDQVLAPLITPFIMIIVFFVLFALVRVLVGVVRSLAVGLSKVPAMNTVNSVLGAAVGIFVACIYVFVGMCVIWAYDATQPLQPLGYAYFSQSIAYRIFYGLNFFI